MAQNFMLLVVVLLLASHMCSSNSTNTSSKPQHPTTSDSFSNPSVTSSNTPSVSKSSTTSTTSSMTSSLTATNASRTAPHSPTKSDSVSTSQQSSQSRTVAMSPSLLSVSVSTSLSSSVSQGTQTLTPTSTLSQSLTASTEPSLSSTVIRVHTRTPPPSHSTSQSVTDSKETSLTKSLTLSSSTTLSLTSSTSLSTSVTASNSPTATNSNSLSSSQSKRPTRSPTVPATPSVFPTSSETFSFNITETISRGTTGKMTPTIGTRTMSMSRSAVVDAVLQSHLSWVQRPLPYAAPGVPFTLQPIVSIDTPFNANFAPQFCTLTSPEFGVVLMGNLIAKVTHGLCIFSGTGILAYHNHQNTTHSVPLVVTLNTTATRYPRLHRSTNTTRVGLAYCDALNAASGSQMVFSLTPPRVKWTGGSTVVDTTISGYYFLYENRLRTVCNLNLTVATSKQFVLVTAPAHFLDMCHVRCVFSASTVSSNVTAFALALAAGPSTGRVSLSVNSVELDSDCAGTDPHYLTGANNPCATNQPPTTVARTDGCQVQLTSNEQVTLQFTPQNATAAVPFVASTGRFQLPSLRISFCDEANNTVFTSAANIAAILAPLSPASMPTACVPQQTQPQVDATASFYGVLCTNISSVVNHTDAACGNPNAEQPIRVHVPTALNTTTAVATAATITYCVRNAQVNASYVMGMEILNADAVLRTTDDQTSLPVPLQVRFFNWLGDTVLRPLDPLYGTSNYPVRVDVLQTNTSTRGVAVVVQSVVMNVSLAQAPVVLSTIMINTAGSGFGIRLAGLSDATPSVTLWGTDYPSRSNITSYSCGAFASLFGLQYSTYMMQNYTLCNGTNTTIVLHDKLPLSVASAGPTVVSVYGWRFDYASSPSTQCQYSTLTAPWSAAASGTQATWVSSCQVLCTIPAQSTPIRQTSASYVTSTGIIRSKASLPTGVSASAMSQLGTLRIKYGLLNSWSNPINLDVVGPAYLLDAGDSWASVQNTFYSKEVTTLDPPLRVYVCDVLSTPLLELDTTSRLVTIAADNASSVDLNVSKVVRSLATTCNPSPGVATTLMVLQSPSTGSYTLSMSAGGVKSGTINVFIISFTNVTSFLMKALVTPYNFNTQTLENPLGTLPRQPVILALNPTTLQLDTSISDVSLIATVTPIDSATPVTTGVNLDDTVCNPAFGNCAVLSSGVATFTKLSFVGVQGANYTLTIRVRNESRAADAQALRYNITAAECTNLPSDLDTMSAALVGPLNASLRGPPSGFLIKGWKFDPAVGVTCMFNGTELPATIVDYCTVRCLLHSNVSNGGGGDVPAANNSNCNVAADGSRVRCNNATGGALYVCNGTCSSPTASITLVTGGNVTYVGRGRSITMVSNVQSSRCLSNGNQAVVSGQQVKLDALLVAVVDSRREFIADVDTTSDGMTVTLDPTLVSVDNPFRVPYAYDGIYNDQENSTCFPLAIDSGGIWYPPMAVSASSSLTCKVHQGLCVFDNLYLDYPRVGAFELFASSSTLTGNATFVLHIVAGPPNRLCIYSLEWPRLRKHVVLIEEDVGGFDNPNLRAGNIFQPGSLDTTLGALPYIINTQGSAPTATIQVKLWGMLHDIETNYSYLQLLPDSVSLASDYTATFSTLSISNATYGSLFVCEFYVEGGSPALAPVFSPPLSLLECTTGQFARWGSQSCETCLSGPSACDGQQDSCFVCNGSSILNVTNGYWRYSSRSYQAYTCPLSSCIGNTELGTCIEGYLNHAPLCAVCDEGYAADFLGECVMCSSLAATAALFVLACIAALVIIAIIVFVTVSEQEDDDNSLVLLLKICVNFIQTSGTIGEFSMDVPSTVKQFLGFQNSVSGGGGISIAPFNCLAPTFTFMTKYRIQMLGPPVAVVVVALACRAITNRDLWLKSLEKLNQYYHKEKNHMVCEQSVSQPRYMTDGIIGENNELVLSVLKNDVRVSCLDSQYQYDFSLVLFSLAIYGLGIPVVALVVVMRTSAKEGWEASYVRYSFLISGYRLRYWFWEIVIFARKIGLLLLVAMTDNATLQALVGIWLLTASLVATIRYQPFVKGVLNQAESLALAVQLITVNVGLFFRTVSTSSSCGVLCVFVSCVLLILNAAVFVYFGRHLMLEGYYRVLGTFGLDVVHSDNRRYVSIRNIKKTILLQLNTSSRADFGLYTPSAQSASIAVSSPRKKKNMVNFVGDEDGSEQVELLVLRRIAPDKGDESQQQASRRSRSRLGTRANASGASIHVPSDQGPGGDSPPLPLDTDKDESPNPSFRASLSFGEQKGRGSPSPALDAGAATAQ
ncbi:membrane-associated protein, putative [Bodo saltans]|uniref:Membrane-associated protein, putative n=1 Tax=Bodo saltans TaxID=75058 RepID=A0A0S4IPK2_BODSA|nr:membrane-associated protein, putative [Bodo saltans]|eukprot:CUF09020.1 membrane-associated protein, putative [Bodo saltans]